MKGRIQAFGARFVGRAGELARLEEALQAAAEQTPAAVVIGGEAGVGKTRLVQEFAARAQQRGARALAGGCVQLSTGGLPYGPIAEALRGLTRDLEPTALLELIGPAPGQLARLLPSLEPLPPAGELERPVGEFGQAQLFEVVLRFLNRLSEQAPVVLIVEDLHWADRSTRDLLAFLVHNLRDERILLVATYRSDDLHSGHPLPAVLAELDRSRLVEHLQLPRFDQEELAELLRGILGTPPPPKTLERIFANSEGNAFYAEELIAAGDHPASGQLPPRLQGLLMARVATLSQEARQILGVAAVIGRRAEHDLLVAASQLVEARLVRGLREAVDRQLLVTERDAYRFRHVLLQEAVYGELLVGERRRLHAAVAQALTVDPHARTLPHTAAELSHHWYAARHYPQALTASITAARAAANVHGFAEAHHQYERSLTLWGQVSDAGDQVGLTLSDLRLEAAEAARWAGLPDRAVALVREALADLGGHMKPTRAGLLYARLGECQSEAGDSKAALAAYEEASRLVANEPDSVEKARVLAGHGTELMRQAQYSASRGLCEQAIAVARAVGARAEEARALNTLGCDLSCLGDPEAGIAALVQALSLSEAATDFDDLVRAYYNLSVVLGFDAGRPHEALQVLQQGLERMRELGLELALPGSMLRSELAGQLCRLGRWQEAEEALTEVLARELPAGWALASQLLLGRIHMARGRFELAIEHAETVASLVEQLSDPISDSCLQSYLAELATLQMDYPAARAATARALQSLADSEQHADMIWLCGIGLRAEADAAERAHDRRTKADVVVETRATGEWLLATARQSLVLVGTNLPEVMAQAAKCEAEFTRLEFRSDPQQWAALAANWDALSRPYEAAYARWRQAEALLANKTPKPAARALRRAHQTATQLDARPLRHEIERLAQRARIDLQTPSPKPKAADPSPPAVQLGLTPREHEVLQHLMQGRTNRQIARALFISEKTASVHVSNIMTKLDAANRGEAAAIAHRLGLDKP